MPWFKCLQLPFLCCPGMLLSKSGYAFSSMIERFSPMGIGAALGGSAVDNNLNMDNVSLGNRQYLPAECRS